MSECPSTSLRNTRKHFVKCVDCGCQTLPQNASKGRPWTAAASLHIRGRVNDGALCFTCANKRREALGLQVETEVDHSERPSPTPACEATLKKVSINRSEYSWVVSTLDSLLTKWRDECFPKLKKDDPLLTLKNAPFIAAVNGKVIPETDFTSTPISDGDAILIVLGGIAGG